MAGLEQTSLSPRQQRLAEKARVALAHGQFDYVREVTGEILRAAPSCVSVRRLQRSAQLGLAGSRVGWVRQARAGLGLARLRLGGAAAASTRLSAAERLLAVDPRNAGVLHVLADAARELGWPETAAWAREAAREVRPGDAANLLALGEAWLAAGQPGAALAVAEALLRLRPADGAALALLRHASLAQTVAEGNWESAGTFRDKLRS